MEGGPEIQGAEDGDTRGICQPGKSPGRLRNRGVPAPAQCSRVRLSECESTLWLCDSSSLCYRLLVCKIGIINIATLMSLRCKAQDSGIVNTETLSIITIIIIIIIRHLLRVYCVPGARGHPGHWDWASLVGGCLPGESHTPELLNFPLCVRPGFMTRAGPLTAIEQGLGRRLEGSFRPLQPRPSSLVCSGLPGGPKAVRRAFSTISILLAWL